MTPIYKLKMREGVAYDYIGPVPRGPVPYAQLVHDLYLRSLEDDIQIYLYDKLCLDQSEQLQKFKEWGIS